MARTEGKRQMNRYQELERRTAVFARECRDFTKQLPNTTANREYAKQLIRSSGSQAANYIEANESVSKKDFLHRIKICRKETKESGLWLQLCEARDTEVLEGTRTALLAESRELRNIFSAILNKST